MPNTIVESRRIQRHIENLNNEDQKVSSNAERYLIRYYGVRALEPLLESCRHPNPVVRFRAAWALGYTQDPRAYEAILQLTDDPDDGVRYDATIALGILGDERGIEPLTRVFLAHDPSRPGALGFSQIGLKTVPVLEELLRNGDPRVRQRAINVIGGFANDHEDTHCIELLESCANDSDPIIRAEAEFWLEEITGKDHSQIVS